MVPRTEIYCYRDTASTFKSIHTCTNTHTHPPFSLYYLLYLLLSYEGPFLFLCSLSPPSSFISSLYLPTTFLLTRCPLIFWTSFAHTQTRIKGFSAISQPASPSPILEAHYQWAVHVQMRRCVVSHLTGRKHGRDEWHVRFDWHIASRHHPTQTTFSVPAIHPTNNELFHLVQGVFLFFFTLAFSLSPLLFVAFCYLTALIFFCLIHALALHAPLLPSLLALLRQVHNPAVPLERCRYHLFIAATNDG